MEAIVGKLFEYNGTALIIDYGYYGQSKDTFRVRLFLIHFNFNF